MERLSATWSQVEVINYTDDGDAIEDNVEYEYTIEDRLERIEDTINELLDTLKL